MFYPTCAAKRLCKVVEFAIGDDVHTSVLSIEEKDLFRTISYFSRFKSRWSCYGPGSVVSPTMVGSAQLARAPFSASAKGGGKKF